VYIPPYQEKNTPKEYDSRRNRRLLLNKNEIRELADSENTKGLTIVPLSVYNKGTKIKLDIAIVRGKKKYDKRESIKKKDSMRDVARDLKNR
jgi:SsrA-binding protein